MREVTDLGRLLSASHNIQSPMHQNVPTPAPRVTHSLPACSQRYCTSAIHIYTQE